jgi:capsid protein
MKKRATKTKSSPKGRKDTVKANYLAFNGADIYTRPDVLWKINLDSSTEVDVAARVNLLINTRFQFNNSSIVKRLAKGVPNFAIGSGLFAVPLTDDEDWNVDNARNFDSWASNKLLCDAHKRRSFYSMQKYHMQRASVDGETFTSQVKYNTGAPALQVFDAMDIGNVGAADESGGGVFDGIGLDSRQCARFYRVLGKNGAHTDVPADSMIHFYDPERALQTRGISWFYTGLVTGRMIMDLMKCEMDAARVQAMVGIIKKIDSPGGGQLPGALGGANKNIKKDPINPDAALESFYRSGAIAYLRPGEDWVYTETKRGSEQFRGFMKFLIADVAWSYGVSPDFLFYIADSGGASVRAGMEDFGWFLWSLQDMLIEGFCNRVYAWKTAVDIKTGRIRKPKGSIPYYTVGWTRPPQITADRAKSALSDIALVNAGLMTMDEYLARYGGGYKQHFDQQKIEYLYASRLAREISVPVSFFIPRLAPAPTPGGIVGPDGQPVSSQQSQEEDANAAQTTADTTDKGKVQKA